MFAGRQRIERHAWYLRNANNQLFSNHNSNPPTLSALGTDFVNAPQYR
jgi:hypothetical protein